MHIEKPNQEFFDAKKTREILETFLSQAIPAEIPPCPNCKEHTKLWMHKLHYPQNQKNSLLNSM